ncbi:MAG: hypothetical protein MRY57_04185 [Candidatus Pacebacteria bacterium]|nr:hypothetical protein [Candidatus Paceibacterota bacterium]
MTLFKVGPFGQAKKMIKNLEKDSKISKEEKSELLNELKKIKKSNSGTHRSQLRNFRIKLDSLNVEKVRIQKETNEIKNEGKEINSENKQPLTLVKAQTDSSEILNEDESDYKQVKELLNTLEETGNKVSLTGVDFFKARKSIGDPTFLENITNRKEYKKEAHELIENSNEENFHDIAIFFKNKKETKNLNRVLQKHLRNCSRVRMLRTVQEIYGGTSEEAKYTVANIYLTQGDYKSAREVYPIGDLAQTALGACLRYAREHHDHLTELHCSVEMNNEQCMVQSIQRLWESHKSILEINSLVKDLPRAHSSFEILLKKLINEEHGENTKTFVQIKNLFKIKNTYKETAKLLIRKLAHLGKYKKMKLIMETQGIEPQEDFVKFVCSNLQDQLVQNHKFNEEQELLGLYTFLNNHNYGSMVAKLKDVIIGYYQRINNFDEYMSFNELMWNIERERITKEEKSAVIAA